MRQHGARKGGVFCGHPVARTRIVCIHVPPLVAVRDHVAAPRGVRSEGTVRCTFVRGDSGGGVNTSGAEGAGWNRPRGEHGGYCTWGGQEPLRRPILVGGCKHVIHARPALRCQQLWTTVHVRTLAARCGNRWTNQAGHRGPGAVGSLLPCWLGISSCCPDTVRKGQRTSEKLACSRSPIDEVAVRVSWCARVT